MIQHAVASLVRRKSILLKVFGSKEASEANIRLLIQTLEFLEKMSVDLVGRVVPGSEDFSATRMPSTISSNTFITTVAQF